MNLDIKSIQLLANRALKKVRKYFVFIFIIAILGIYGFLVFQIGELSRAEPDEDKITEQLKTAVRPKIDEESIKKIRQLEDQNISVKSLFEQARENPFQSPDE